jgi:hypothetical protein
MTIILGRLSWGNLRKIASSKVVQSAALFPFIGYLALTTDLSKGLIEQISIIKGLTLLSPQSRLFLIYLGLASIGFGVVIYNVRCPFLIKRFQDENALAQFYMQMAGFGQVYAMLIAVLGSPDASPNPMHREVHARFGEFSRDPATWQQFLSTHREEIFGFYVDWYSQQGMELPTSRVICAACLAMGFLLLSLPSFDAFVGISRAFWRSL